MLEQILSGFYGLAIALNLISAVFLASVFTRPGLYRDKGFRTFSRSMVIASSAIPVIFQMVTGGGVPTFVLGLHAIAIAIVFGVTAGLWLRYRQCP